MELTRKEKIIKEILNLDPILDIEFKYRSHPTFCWDYISLMEATEEDLSYFLFDMIYRAVDAGEMTPGQGGHLLTLLNLRKRNSIEVKYNVKGEKTDTSNDALVAELQSKVNILQDEIADLREENAELKKDGAEKVEGLNRQINHLTGIVLDYKIKNNTDIDSFVQATSDLSQENQDLKKQMRVIASIIESALEEEGDE